MGGNKVFEMIPFPSRFSVGWEGTRFNRSDFISKAISVGGWGGHRVVKTISFPSHFVGEVGGRRRVFDASCDS
jgi:hypothetical protein